MEGHEERRARNEVTFRAGNEAILKNRGAPDSPGTPSCAMSRSFSSVQWTERSPRKLSAPSSLGCSGGRP